MAEPLSLIAIGAAVGGAAGKFVEKAWDSGEKWLATYFANHQQKAREKATANTGEFLNDLAHRISQFEKDKIIPPEQITTAQEHPDFSVILQKAMLSAAQTEIKDKHHLLSRLVAERIKAASESIISLASKMACDAISFTTLNQLKILGLDASILYVVPTAKTTAEQYNSWLQARLKLFMDVNITNLDFIHLESVSCLKYESFLTRDLSTILSNKNENDFSYGQFKQSDLGKYLADVWDNQGLRSAELTSVGQIIGIMVADQLTGSQTDMKGWE